MSVSVSVSVSVAVAVAVVALGESLEPMVKLEEEIEVVVEVKKGETLKVEEVEEVRKDESLKVVVVVVECHHHLRFQVQFSEKLAQPLMQELYLCPVQV